MWLSCQRRRRRRSTQRGLAASPRRGPEREGRGREGTWAWRKVPTRFHPNRKLRRRMAARATRISQEEKKGALQETGRERDGNKIVSDPVGPVRPRPGRKPTKTSPAPQRRQQTKPDGGGVLRGRASTRRTGSLGLPPACLAAGRAGAPPRPLRGHARGRGGGRRGAGGGGGGGRRRKGED